MVGIPGEGGGTGSSGYGCEGGFPSGAGVGLGRVSGGSSGSNGGISGDWGDGLSGVTIFYISSQISGPGRQGGRTVEGRMLNGSARRQSLGQEFLNWYIYFVCERNRPGFNLLIKNT
jgi:hypothetical protein